MVRILILINKHMLEPTAIKRHYLWVLHKDAHDFTDEIIKIHRIRGTQAALVLREDASNSELKRVLGLFGLSQCGLWRGHFVLMVRNLVSQYA